MVHFRTAAFETHKTFYREAGDPQHPLECVMTVKVEDVSATLAAIALHQRGGAAESAAT